MFNIHQSNWDIVSKHGHDIIFNPYFTVWAVGVGNIQWSAVVCTKVIVDILWGTINWLKHHSHYWNVISEIYMSLIWKNSELFAVFTSGPSEIL